MSFVLRSLQKSHVICNPSFTCFRVAPNCIMRVASTQAIEKTQRKPLPAPYEGPERDLVNFPRPVRALYSGKVRLGFVPDEWFQFFYKKTGVTGPYLYGFGLLTFLFSKEIWVIEHEFWTGVTELLMILFAVKKFGPKVFAYLKNEVDMEEKKFDDMKANAMKQLEDNITAEKLNQWQATGSKLLFDAKKENIQLQLEAEYRRRLMHSYVEVKKRLDYQMELLNTRRKLEQKNMVEWIVANVVKSITPQQEKDAMQKCIEDLKMLSARV